MSETVSIEPNWPNMRRWLRNLHRTDPQTAERIAETMGDESPEHHGGWDARG